MSKKRRPPRRRRRRSSTSQESNGIRLVTPEGDPLLLASACYQHAELEEVRRLLEQAEDFNLDDDSGGTLLFSWIETRPGQRSLPALIGHRVLAELTLTPAALEVEAMSQQRLGRCRHRLEELLGERIRLLETQTRSPGQAQRPRSQSRAGAGEPIIPPPEVIAEIEEQMLNQWLNESIPALDGLTPREAVKTAKGRQQVLELLDYIEAMQKKTPKTPGMFSPDYSKIKKMLGL